MKIIKSLITICMSRSIDMTSHLIEIWTSIGCEVKSIMFILSNIYYAIICFGFWKSGEPVTRFNIYLPRLFMKKIPCRDCHIGFYQWETHDCISDHIRKLYLDKYETMKAIILNLSKRTPTLRILLKEYQKFLLDRRIIREYRQSVCFKTYPKKDRTFHICRIKSMMDNNYLSGNQSLNYHVIKFLNDKKLPYEDKLIIEEFIMYHSKIDYHPAHFIIKTSKLIMNSVFASHVLYFEFSIAMHNMIEMLKDDINIEFMLACLQIIPIVSEYTRDMILAASRNIGHSNDNLKLKKQNQRLTLENTLLRNHIELSPDGSEFRYLFKSWNLQFNKTDFKL